MLLILHFPLLSPNYLSRCLIRIWNNIKLVDLVWFLFFCIFNLTEQWGSSRYQTRKQYQVAGLGMLLIFFCIFNLTDQWVSPCYQTLKQNQVVGIGMLLILQFLFFQPTIRVAVSLEFETISSCWVWYGNDVFFLCCHQTIWVAMLLEFGTKSDCWTWYGTDISFAFCKQLSESTCH